MYSAGKDTFYRYLNMKYFWNMYYDVKRVFKKLINVYNNYGPLVIWFIIWVFVVPTRSHGLLSIHPQDVLRLEMLQFAVVVLCATVKSSALVYVLSLQNKLHLLMPSLNCLDNKLRTELLHVRQLCALQSMQLVFRGISLYLSHRKADKLLPEIVVTRSEYVSQWILEVM